MKALEIATDSANETTTTHLSIVPQPKQSRGGSFTSEVYRLHSFRVLDAEGKKVGIVDWVWTDQESGHGEFLGVRLHWLRGTARAIPSLGAGIDLETSTIRVAHTAAQIERARRFKIDRKLTAREKRRICLHYALEPAALPSFMPVRSVAA
jgi:hypothetical protein